MNIAQAIRQAAFDLSAVLQNNTPDPFYGLQPMLSWATDGNSKLEKSIRTAKEDYGLLILQSNDVAYTWCGVTYDPSVLTLTEGQRMYTLPPDLLMVKSIRSLDNDAVIFQYKDMSDPAFEPVGDVDEHVGASLVYFDVVGENTLVLGSDPPGGVSIELSYISRPAPFQIESTGTISVNFGSAIVSGAGTSWAVKGLQPNLELIISDDATTPKILSQVVGGTWVDPSLQYYPVNQITGDGTLTLLANWAAGSIANRGYVLATVPTLPKEYHQALVDYICYRALRSRRVSAADNFLKSFNTGLADMRVDTQPRQEQSPVFIEGWNP